MPSRIVTIEGNAWSGGGRSPQHAEALEGGDVLFLPALGFAVEPEDLRLFSPDLFEELGRVRG
jgi:hypothetical protein